MKIYAPVEDTNGVRASVRFVNGVGETDNPHLIQWFKQRGYRVVDDSPNLLIPPTNEQIEAANDEVEMMGYSTREPDFDKMTPNELREWAKENGFGSQIKNTRNKDKLLEIIRG